MFGIAGSKNPPVLYALGPQGPPSLHFHFFKDKLNLSLPVLFLAFCLFYPLSTPSRHLKQDKKSQLSWRGTLNTNNH